jgi:HNH endonuclease
VSKTCPTCQHNLPLSAFEPRRRKCRTCHNLARNVARRAPPKLREAPPAYGKFTAMVDKDPDGCWEWMGAHMPNGYGQYHTGEKVELAHRVSWKFANGKIPDGIFVCHKCDNPGCVRPDHLFLGDDCANMLDMQRKGRRTCTLTRDSALRVHELRRAGQSIRKIALEIGAAHAHVRPTSACLMQDWPTCRAARAKIARRRRLRSSPALVPGTGIEEAARAVDVTDVINGRVGPPSGLHGAWMRALTS